MLKENIENIQQEESPTESLEVQDTASPEIDAVREEVQNGTKMITDENMNKGPFPNIKALSGTPRALKP